jgi:hypothetical protein
MLSERKLCAEVVHSGTWLYDDQVLSDANLGTGGCEKIGFRRTSDLQSK